MAKHNGDAALVKEVMAQIAKMPVEEIKADLDVMEIPDVAKKLRVGRSTAYQLVNDGKLPGFKLGTLTRVRPRALYAYILLREKQAMGAAA